MYNGYVAAIIRSVYMQNTVMTRVFGGGGLKSLYNKPFNANFNNKKLKKHLGFTLAEVLITLGIIGVIAALLLPMLIENFQAVVLESQLKKGASTIYQALEHYQADNDGEVIKADNDLLGAQELGRLIRGYFNILVYCGYAYNDSKAVGCVSFNSDGNVNEVYRNYNNTNGFRNNLLDDDQFILMDGSMIFIECGNDRRHIYITVDVNGFKKRPNRVGHDLFMFQIDKNGKLLAMGAPGTDYYSENDEYCSTTSTSNMNGAGCTYKALNEKGYFKRLPK